MKLFDLEGVRFFSLQKGDREPEVADAPASVVRLNERLHSFRDPAVPMRRLDLVVTTCPSAAHLASALGRPVWVVLSRNPALPRLVWRVLRPWSPLPQAFRHTETGRRA